MIIAKSITELHLKCLRFNEKLSGYLSGSKLNPRGQDPILQAASLDNPVPSQTKTNIYYHLGAESEIRYKGTCLPNRNRSTDLENDQGGKVEGGKDRLGIWDEHVHMAILKRDNQGTSLVVK